MKRVFLITVIALAVSSVAGASTLATLTVTTDVRDMGYTDGDGNAWYYMDVYFETDTAYGVRGSQIDGVTPMANAPVVGAHTSADWGTKVSNGGFSTINPVLVDDGPDGDIDVVGCSYYIASPTADTDATIGVGVADLIVSMYFMAPPGSTPVEVRPNLVDPRYFSGTYELRSAPSAETISSVPRKLLRYWLVPRRSPR